jgi:perosamine synthetase
MRIEQFGPFLNDEELASVTEVLKRNWITEGEKTRTLEHMLQDYCRVKHAIMLPNGTLTLFVALKILDVGPGDEVMVPDFTFVGSATSVVLAGAKPVFCDVNLDDFNMSIESLERNLSEATKAIMPVHIYGQPADMDPILQIAADRGLRIVEDAAQGMGVTYKGKHTGTIGDVGCISFYADKTITTAEGGAVLTNDDSLARRCRYFKNQGRAERGSFIHPEVGYNFRITDLQAALGVVQMRKLDMIIKKKAHNEMLYKKYTEDIPEVELPERTTLGERVPFRVNILVEDPEALGNYLTENEIGVRRFFYPLHKQPCFNESNSVIRSAPVNSSVIFSRGLSLPSSVALTEEEIRFVCDKIRAFYGR